jgi:hypothetical protein
MNTTTKKAANSIVGKLTAGIVATVAALLAIGGPAHAADRVLVVGDSLEVGSAPYLRQALPGISLDIDARTGRPSREGVSVLADKLRPDDGTIVFPLGTNDTSAATLASSLAAVRQLAGGRCIVVATISRPPLGGSTAASLNSAIEAFAAQSGAQVADWASAVAATPGVLGRDRVHPGAEGRLLRASILADAVQSCLLGGDLGGLPAPRNPNARPPRRTAEAPAAPATFPVQSAVDGIAGALAQVIDLMRGAISAAETAASKPGPEPVLGAP